MRRPKAKLSKRKKRRYLRQTEESKPRGKYKRVKSKGRKPTISQLEEIVKILGKCPVNYEQKGERAKLRTDKIFSEIIRLLAPSLQGQGCLIQRFINGHQLVATSKTEVCGGQALKKLCFAYNDATSPHERQYLLQFMNHCSFKQLQLLGVDGMSKKVLYTSKVSGALPMHKDEQPSRAAGSTANLMKRAGDIEEFCEVNSVPSWSSGAMRHCIPEDLRRTLKAPLWTLARTAQGRGICSATTFVANIPDRYLRPTRKTDMCRYCDDVRLKSKQPAILKELLYHQSCAARQEKAFRDSIDAACLESSRTLVIRLDYKGSTVIGHGAVERDDAVYGLGLLRICGFVAWFNCPGISMPVYIDAVSEVMNADSSVSCATLKLVVQKLLTDQKTKGAVQRADTLMLWSDCGQHFRSHVFTYCALWEIFDWLKKLRRVQLNFFAEKHGKGECDQHFSVVERYKSHYEKHLKRIQNVTDFIAAQQAVLSARNALRQLASEPEVYWLFIKYTGEDVLDGSRKAAKIPRLQSTYCLARERFQSCNQLWIMVFSDLWGMQRESQSVQVDITNYARGLGFRVNPGAKSPQDSNVVWLKCKREYHEQILTGPTNPSEPRDDDDSENLTENSDALSSE